MFLSCIKFCTRLFPPKCFRAVSHVFKLSSKLLKKYLHNIHFMASILYLTTLLSVLRDLPMLDISWNWHQAICDLSWLAFFTSHNAFKAHWCRISILSVLHSLYCLIPCHRMSKPHCVYPFISWWVFGVFPFFGYYE